MMFAVWDSSGRPCGIGTDGYDTKDFKYLYFPSPYVRI